jgi:hypothetical protein
MLAGAAQAPEELPPSARERLDQELNSDDGAETMNAWWLESRGEIASARAEKDAIGSRTRYLPFGVIELRAAAPAETRAKRRPGAWTGYPVDLFPSDPPTGPCDAGGYLTPARYVVQFPARATFWRYFIAGRSGDLDHRSLSVSGPGLPDPFMAAGPSLLPDGTEATCFVAGGALKLRQRAEASFSLLGAAGAGRNRPRVLIRRLPAPSAEMILPDPQPPPGRQSPARIWSDVYVFV